MSNTNTARDERFSGWKTLTITKRQMLAFEAKLTATSDERFQRDFRFAAEGTKALAYKCHFGYLLSGKVPFWAEGKVTLAEFDALCLARLGLS